MFWLQTPATASENTCTEWQKQSGVSCIWLGSSADVYRRDCTNTCYRQRIPRRTNMPNCDRAYFCHPQVHPADMNTTCTKWEANRSVSCKAEDTGRFNGKSWRRSCLRGVEQVKCSKRNPNL